MLSKNRKLFVGIFGAAGALALAVGCGGSSDSGAGGGGGSSTGGSGGGTVDPPCTDCTVPPAQPSGAPTGDGAGTTLAVNKLYLGDTDWSGNPSPDAWKDFGYDLDGFKSTKNSANHCKVNPGGSKAAIQTDGNGGIDNSFGYNILPIIINLATDASTKINDNLDAGAFTIIVKIDGIGGGANYAGLPAALYAGGQLVDANGNKTAPKWDGTDEWPVYCELMNDCQTSGTKQIADGNDSKVKFLSSYVADHTWVSGSKGNVSLSLSVSGYSLSLTIRNAVLTAKLDGSNPPAGATHGIIAGILETEELISSLKAVAGNIDSSLCEGPTFDNIAQQIRAASDIMKDGTQNPDALCDGISIGLGFDMKPVQLGKVMDKAEAGPNPCAQ
jgi:hypothetical protein